MPEIIPPEPYNKIIDVKRCPVCDGRGNHQAGFYDPYFIRSTTNNTTAEICRSCNGTGLIFI